MATMMRAETPETEQLHRIRHSLAHVLAQAVLQMRPGATLGFGPAIKDGFYFDFVLPKPLSEDDFPEIQRRMTAIINEGQQFECEPLSKQDALSRLEAMGEPYKAEYAAERLGLDGNSEITFYRNGPFVDMCEGPHVNNTKELRKAGFQLRSITGAYWRGDSKRQMMTRVYAWAFASKQELSEYVTKYQDALKRDHRKIGKEQGLFVIDDEIGKGLPLWLPAGTVLRDELEKLAKEFEFRAGYQRVCTPHLAKVELFYKTGHLPYYEDHLFPMMTIKERHAGESGADGVSSETYVLKPMNCPHHHKIFASQPRSYRDLPLRLAEYGTVYRLEDSGTLSGLLRVRGMTMNDGHIYCTEEQIEDEFLQVIEMHQQLYKLLGLGEYYMRFSTWDPDDPKGKSKFVDNPSAWMKTQALVERAMKKSGIPYENGVGEAAFYGPKIDVQFRSVTGREETASTSQVNFAVPERMGLTYVASDGSLQRPYVIHRAPLGTHERFIALLAEHFGGAFPLWLSPVQVAVLTVSERFDEYGSKLMQVLRDALVRVELTRGSETLGKKVRNATLKKVPLLLIVGEREQADNAVTVRRRAGSEETMNFEKFRVALLAAIAERRPEL